MKDKPVMITGGVYRHVGEGSQETSLYWGAAMVVQHPTA
jgi:hypothetical protein